MRIWSVLAQSPPCKALGGAELQMHSLHKGLMERGVDVHVIADICRVGKRFQLYDGLPIWGVRFPHFGIKGLLLMWLSWPATKEIALTRIPRPDLIHATMFREPAILANRLACLWNVPWTIRLAGSGNNGDFHYSKQRWFIRHKLPILTKTVTRVVALDEATHAEACAAGIPLERIEIIPNGVSLLRKGSKIYQPINRTSKPLTIVYAGRLVAAKRVDTLLQSVKMIHDKKPDIILRVIIAGDGPDKERLMKIVKELAIDNFCQFTGRLSSIEGSLQEADCFVNPSESEGLPNAVLEALYCGVPVILSDIPVHRKLAEESCLDRFCFQVGDQHSLVNALIDFINLSCADKNSLSKKCYLYGERFSATSRDQRYLSFFSNVAGSSGSSGT
jgi:glycosyltransferase involved in cell wall biosynthesis